MQYGRKRLFTDYTSITSENVVEVLRNSYIAHLNNASDIQKLYDYYTSKHDIQEKQKEFRENINHKVTINLPYKTVNYKLGNVMGEDVQYIRKGDANADDIDLLNDIFDINGKRTNDKKVFKWALICGVGYRIALPSQDDSKIFDDYCLDPRDTFIVYSNSLSQKPLMGVKYITNVTNNEKIFSVYTEDMYYEIVADKITKAEPHAMKYIPIIEYDLNDSLLGSYEVALSIVDAINEIESNRIDDVVQYVNSILAIFGSTIDEDTYDNIYKYKMMGLPDGVDAKYLTTALNETDVQAIVEDLYEHYLSIVGLPNRGTSKGGSSDNGVAVYYREGYQDSETQALGYENMWKQADKSYLSLALHYMAQMAGVNLKLKDIEIKFARRYSDNILTKTQTLIQLLDAGVAPSVAFTTVGIWNDAYSVYEESQPYLAKWEVNDVSNNGQELEEIENQDME